ncbi:MAG: lamin tail domain-containing protein [Polyangiaceae bacterium]
MIAFAIAGAVLFSGCSDSSSPASSIDAGRDADIITPAYGNGYEDSGVIIGGGGSGGPDTIDEDASSPGALVINELDYDEPSTDDSEFVEILNTTGAAIDVSNNALSFVNSSSEYLRVNLTGSIPAGGYLVVADTAVTVGGTAAVIRFTKATGNIRNGPDAVAIVDRTTGDIIDALSYGGEISGYVEGTATDAVDSSTSAGSLIRYPNGSDTNDASTDWIFTTSITPGVANVKAP